MRYIRTIPTRVGNTNGRDGVFTRQADHPHARGEHLLVDALRPWVRGPSPRAWGTRRAYDCPQHTFRTIPTRVGNT